MTKYRRMIFAKNKKPWLITALYLGFIVWVATSVVRSMI